MNFIFGQCSNTDTKLIHPSPQIKSAKVSDCETSGDELVTTNSVTRWHGTRDSGWCKTTIIKMEKSDKNLMQKLCCDWWGKTYYNANALDLTHSTMPVSTRLSSRSDRPKQTATTIRSSTLLLPLLLLSTDKFFITFLTRHGTSCFSVLYAKTCATAAAE